MSVLELRAEQGFTLVVPGEPVPWAPKAVNTHTRERFVPGRQSHAIGRIMDAFQRHGNGFFAPKGTSVVLGVQFYVERPGYHYGSGRNAQVVKDRYLHAWPSGRPDLSNLIKLVEDALTKVAWADDDQVVGLQNPFKAYTSGQPRTEIRVRLAQPFDGDGADA